nr:hypothetical protein [Tanacetum cinerariifolium]
GDKEEGEHLAPADSTAVALPTVDHAPSAEETEPFKTKSESASAPTIRPAGDSRQDYGFIATMDDEIMQDLERDV